MKAENLKKLRISLGLTTGGCAIGMGVTRQTIINIESGRTSKESSLQHYELYLKDIRRKQEERDNYKRRISNGSKRSSK